jgi:crotonobetainyl-CoA:carnitine CoA-transferase CaiB-like acyl-CoA transferase
LSSQNPAKGAIAGLKIFDLTRVLAGPTCVQMLADLGAEVIKIEKPNEGDETRFFTPPVMPGSGGSAYFASTNRNKQSLTLDISTPDGQQLALRLIAQCDILIENFKTGTLARYGLDYARLHAQFPGLIYCSITGFGQTGPYAKRPGYDAVIQAMSGMMSLTGAPDGLPQRVGVPVADLFGGLYACIGVLAALRHKEQTGLGQQVDISLLDAGVASMANQAVNYLATGQNPVRLGSAHASIVPYQVFETADGAISLTIANDAAFARFCRQFGLEDLPGDARFTTNAARVANREFLIGPLSEVLKRHETAWWVEQLALHNIGNGPIYRLSDVFSDPQVTARGDAIEMTGAEGEKLRLVANPVRLSETPVSYRVAPPALGQHSTEILRNWLGLDEAEIGKLRDDGII